MAAKENESPEAIHALTTTARMTSVRLEAQLLASELGSGEKHIISNMRRLVS